MRLLVALAAVTMVATWRPASIVAQPRPQAQPPAASPAPASPAPAPTSAPTATAPRAQPAPAPITHPPSQPAAPAGPAPAPAEPAAPAAAEGDTEPADEPAPAPAPAEPAAQPGVTRITPPMQWTEWEITGHLIDPMDTVRAVIEPEMQTRRALTDQAQAELAQATQRYGYELVGFDTATLPGGGVRARLHLEPIPVVRRVDIVIGSRFSRDILYRVTLEDELRRRMRLREGAFLAYAAGARQAELDEEAQHIAEYLRDEGFFDAQVEIRTGYDGSYGVYLGVRVRLGRPYDFGRIRIQNERDLAISGDAIRDAFLCTGYRDSLLGHWACPSIVRARFTRSNHQSAIQAVTALLRTRGYPSVKITTDFDPATSFDRRRHTVNLTITIDQRRHIDVVFEGNDKDRFPDDTLAQKLTFAEAGSADEFEVAASAAALHEYYQSRGYFDAIVSSSRESFRSFDRIIYRIDEGPRRSVQGVPRFGPHPAVSEREMLDAVGDNKYSSGLLKQSVRPTASSLADDANRIRRLYHDHGYLAAEVSVRVAPAVDGLDSAALAGAQIAADRHRGDLYLRFDVVEGPRTILDQVRITFEGAHAATCAQVLAQIGTSLGVGDLASKTLRGDPCIAAGVGVPGLSDKLETGAARLKDWYWGRGRGLSRPRAEIAFKLAPSPTRATSMVADFRIREREEVRLGKVLVRGNFKTRTWIIRDELGFEEGLALTGDRYATGPRRLRTTALFNAVNVDLVNFDDTPDGRVHTMVRVEERYTGTGYVQLEAGYSYLKHTFLTVAGALPNFYGTGIQPTIALTAGISDVEVAWSSLAYGSIDASLRLPHWIPRRVLHLPRWGTFDVDIGGAWRVQNTPRFGRLTTISASVALTRAWQRPRTETRPARSLSATLRYDFRLRNREDEALRPAGADIESRQVTVETKSAALGIELAWDQRTDRLGNLSPLVPERGFQLQVGASYAHPYLLPWFFESRDTFIKLFAAGQFYRTLSNRVLLRVDGRLDQGIPLDGAVLLPEVERYFAGGDTTVRGFEEDRLATEVIEGGLPPFAGVSQLRVLPAGGNLRALGSIDAQLRVARLPGTSLPMASAVFVDAGIVRNTWLDFDRHAIRPSIGLSLLRILTPVGSFALDYAVPMFPQLGDNPRGRLHVSVALRN